MSEKILEERIKEEESFLAEHEKEKVSEVIETASDTIVVAKDKEESAKKKDLAFSQHSTFFKQQLEQAMILEMQRQEMAFIRDSKSNSSYHMQRALNYDLLKERMANSVKQTPEFIALDEEKQAAYLAALDSHLEQGKIDYHNTLLQKTYQNLKAGGAFQEYNRRQNIILLKRAGFTFPSELSIEVMFNNFSKLRKSEDNANKFQQFQGVITNLPDLQLSDEEKSINFAKFLDKIKAFNFSEEEKRNLIIRLQDKNYLNKAINFGLSIFSNTGKKDENFFFELARNRDEFVDIAIASRGGSKYGLYTNVSLVGLTAVSAVALSTIGAPLMGALVFGLLAGSVTTVLGMGAKGIYDSFKAGIVSMKSGNKDFFNQKFAKNFPSLDKALTLLEQQTDLTPEQKQVILDRLKSNDKKTVEDMQFNLIQAYAGQASEQDRKQALSNLI